MAESLRIALINLECTYNDILAFTLEGSEIIEIATTLCELSSDAVSIVESLELYVKPLSNPVLTDLCLRATGIEQHTIDGSNLLIDALPEFQYWMLNHTVNAWGTWGSIVRSQLIIESRLKELSNPLANIKHFDIRRLFAKNFGHQVELSRALNICGLTFDSRTHTGIDATRNIARLLSHEESLRNAIFKMRKPN